MTDQVRHFYRKFRAHQMNVANEGGGTFTTYPNGRVERSYASAPYGEHAVSALAAAKRHAHSMTDMKRMVRK